MNNHTAKHFVLQLGSLIALYLSLAFFLVLTFGFINLRFPDATDGPWQLESAASSIRIGFAMVVVFFPTYLVLTRMVNKNRRASNDTSYLGLTKWLIYLSLLVAGLTLLGDMVAVIMGFLEGELTMRFLLKALAVAVVTGAAFFYYIKDAQGFWLTREKLSYVYAGVAATLITAVLVSALAYIPNPAKVREMKIDNQSVGALQDMQWRIEDYYRANEALPADLQELFGEFDVPTAPEGRPDYTYTVTSEEEPAFQLCATFAYDQNDVSSNYRPMDGMMQSSIRGNYNWDYKAGEWCFDRTIDKEYRQ